MKEKKDIIWFKQSEHSPTIRITVNISSGSARLAFNTQMMNLIKGPFIKVGADPKTSTIIVEETKNEEGLNTFPFKITERTKIFAINLKNKADFFKDNNLVGLHKMAYKDGQYITQEIEKEKEKNM